MLPHLMWLDIMQALPVFSSAGETSLFQITMALSWVIQLPTERYLVALHKQRMWLRQQIKPHWPVLTNTLTTASQCLRQHQRDEEIKVHLLWSSQMKTVSFWFELSYQFCVCILLLSLFVKSFANWMWCLVVLQLSNNPNYFYCRYFWSCDIPLSVTVLTHVIPLGVAVNKLQTMFCTLLHI